MELRSCLLLLKGHDGNAIKRESFLKQLKVLEMETKFNEYFCYDNAYME